MSDFSAFALFTAGLAIISRASALTVPGGSDPTAGAVTAPDASSNVVAGTAFQIQWNSSAPNCGDKVDLVLLYGPSAAQMNAESYIVQGAPNSGSYSWTPESSLEPSDDVNKYGIELICDSTQAYQYTTRFSLANSDYTGSSSTSGSPSGTSGASSSTESPKYPSGNSTSSGVASSTHHHKTTDTASSSGAVSTATSIVTGSQTTDASMTSSATSSSASASGTGNGAEHAKAGFGGLLAAAAVAAFAL